MTDSDSVNYVAIITIRLPETAKVTELTVTLTPGDPVTTTSGQVKPLRDCTLAELQQFADAIEAELWSGYQTTRLDELADNDEAQVEIKFLDLPADAVPEGQWLNHSVLFPADEEESDAPVEAVKEGEQTESLAEDDDTEAADTLTPVASEVADEPEAEQELQDKVESGAEDEDDLSDSVAVAEPEQVHAEREAGQGPRPSPIFRPHIRILGRRRPQNHPTWTAVDILMNEAAFRDSQAHALSSMNREVAGILVGPQPEKQPDGRYVVHISDTIIAKHTRMQGASVTYTPESWRYVNDRLTEMYPDESAVIVGWYHTHPGFGIFLSGMDQFIHQNFFTQIWHVALVLDPLARRSGFFCWDRHKARVDRYEFPWPDWASTSW